ncbi:MAG: alanine--tRNA ligase [Endozoicomonadaceae bacterium]|nr:alanine--tRNA ligase [Endozoicomonadaceae bacterium]
MKSAEIRSIFLTFFRDKGHTVVPGGSLVPGNDPTLLFTNAGMNQFKEVFLGKEKRSYTKAASIQKCIRAGGKHNDLENVGYTKRHHTFFEMLGNFSFGDYFKREAIHYAWEFLTVTLGIPEEKLWVTVYEKDQEAEDIWLKELNVSAERFSRLGEKDNFWSMGETGPCGPCSEIFYDHGNHVPGGAPGEENDDGDRYTEIWNMVFMQFNRTADGQINPLPKPSIDTGMGLERIAAVMQGVTDNYETDTFKYLLKAASDLLGGVKTTDNSLRVIADHIRSCAFLIADGILPANEGRGYVLRRIIRRACRHGHKLGAEEAFFYKLVPALTEVMRDTSASLIQQQQYVTSVLKKEEEQFNKTLDKGMKILNAEISDLKKDAVIDGKIIFTLYDTYGFPVDLIGDIAREQQLNLDLAGYKVCMDEQRDRARAASQFNVNYTAETIQEGVTEFVGYEYLQKNVHIKQILVAGKPAESIQQGDEAVLILDQTPFYAEAGGQKGDSGVIYGDECEFFVKDTTKAGAHHLHAGTVKKGNFTTGQSVVAAVDESLRQATAANHSATHLLHAALRKILGNHVQQKGSLVDAQKLRFDFSHMEPLTATQLDEIQRLVNKEIRKNSTVLVEEMNIEKAREQGALALFGEKYADDVRVLTMGTNRFSVELCGGTHVIRTGNIGIFSIVSESGIASGVRRIEALTGSAAELRIAAMQDKLNSIAAYVKSGNKNVVDKVAALVAENKALERQIERLHQKQANLAGNDLEHNAIEIKGIKLLAVSLSSGNIKSLRETVDQLKQKLGESIIVLAVENDNKIALATGVTKKLANRVNAGDLVRFVAMQIDGKGGGRSEFGQGGGNNATALPVALASVKDWVETKL